MQHRSTSTLCCAAYEWLSAILTRTMLRNGFEEMFEDEEAFLAQMDSIAFVGRIDPSACTGVLSKMMAEAYEKLSSGQVSPQLSETVYWLACFAGHLLADELTPDYNALS